MMDAKSKKKSAGEQDPKAADPSAAPADPS